MARKQKKDQASENNALFTERADIAADVKAVARRLGDGGHSLFRTRAHNDGGTALWLEAVKNPLTGRWALIRQRQLPDGTRYQEPPRAGSVCFFDALYYGAGFELQYDLGAAALPEGGNAAHYSVVADAADIPLDDDGLPHPAVNGAALTTAVFSPTADAVLARTVNKDLPPEPENKEDATQLDRSFALALVKTDGNKALPATTDNADFIGRSLSAREKEKEQRKSKRIVLRETKKRAKKYNKVAKQAQKTNRFVANASYYTEGFEFPLLAYTGIIPSFCVTITLFPFSSPFLIIPLAFYTPVLIAGLISIKMAEKKENSVGRKLMKAAQSLPDGEEKNLVLAFAHGAQAIRTFGYVSTLQEKIAAGNGRRKKLEKLQEKGLKLIDRAADEINMPEDARQNLKDRFRAGTYPTTKEFDTKLTELHTRLQERLQDRIQKIRDDVVDEFRVSKGLPPVPPEFRKQFRDGLKALPAPSV